MGIDAMLRGAGFQQKPLDAHGEAGVSAEVPIEGTERSSGDGMGMVVGRGVGGRKLSEPVEVTSVSYLSVPDTTSNRRPSTADLVIEKLQLEKVEGGGLSIQGVGLASHCHVTLCVFGVFFMLAGVILSYVSYSVKQAAEEERGQESAGAEDPDGPERLSSVSQMRMIGPSFLVLGLLMLGLGISLCILAKKISRDEKVKQLVISEQQLWQLENSFSYANSNASPLHTMAPAPHQQYPILAVRRNSWWMDPSLGEYGASPVDARDSGVQCPSPIGEVVSGTLSRPITPGPLDHLSDSSGDIACFPPSPLPELVGDLVNLLPVAGDSEDCAHQSAMRTPLSLPFLNPATNTSSSSSSPTDPDSATLDMKGEVRRDSPFTVSQEGRGNKPPSASQGRRSPARVPFSSAQIPSIQVTAAPPVAPLLPRLSRHCNVHMDSRPTTAHDS